MAKYLSKFICLCIRERKCVYISCCLCQFTWINTCRKGINKWTHIFCTGDMQLNSAGKLGRVYLLRWLSAEIVSQQHHSFNVFCHFYFWNRCVFSYYYLHRIRILWHAVFLRLHITGPFKNIHGSSTCVFVCTLQSRIKLYFYV